MIKDALKAATQRLADNSPSPRLDAEVLLAEVLARPRSYLYTHPDQVLQPEDALRFQALIAQRAAGMPVAYLTGRREFWSLPLRVDPSTLIPRPETELLVATALELLTIEQACVLELGTGSGAIALALASERPQWSLVASDASQTALRQAQANARNLSLNKVVFFCGDWLSAVGNGPRFDAILSNPPYLAATDPHQSQGDLRFEPKTALVSGPEGLDALRKIIDESLEHLKPEGFLLVEHGHDQVPRVVELFRNAHYRQIRSWTDGQDHPRITAGWRSA